MQHKCWKIHSWRSQALIIVKYCHNKTTSYVADVNILKFSNTRPVSDSKMISKSFFAIWTTYDRSLEISFKIKSINFNWADCSFLTAAEGIEFAVGRYDCECLHWWYITYFCFESTLQCKMQRGGHNSSSFCFVFFNLLKNLTRPRLLAMVQVPQICAQKCAMAGTKSFFYFFKKRILFFPSCSHKIRYQPISPSFRSKCFYSLESL